MHRFFHRFLLMLVHAVSCFYLFLLIAPSIYCYHHYGCRGAGEGDAFMPAFFFSFIGVPALIGSLIDAIRQFKNKNPWRLLYAPIAILSGVALFGITVAILMAILVTVVLTVRGDIH
jgi:hypothetical protein